MHILLLGIQKETIEFSIVARLYSIAWQCLLWPMPLARRFWTRLCNMFLPISRLVLFRLGRLQLKRKCAFVVQLVQLYVGLKCVGFGACFCRNKCVFRCAKRKLVVLILCTMKNDSGSLFDWCFSMSARSWSPLATFVCMCCRNTL